MTTRGILGTNSWKKWWAERDIDWGAHYFNVDHPHRNRIIAALARLRFSTVFEIGCGAGANLWRIERAFPGSQVGGYDVSPGAIKFAKTVLSPRAVLEVGDTKNVYLSSKGTDMVITDMCLHYLSNKDFRTTLQEIQRIARVGIVLCEFHSSSPWKRLKLLLNSGYRAHNYLRELKRAGFYDVTLEKLRPEDWPPAGEPQLSFGYIISAKS